MSFPAKPMTKRSAMPGSSRRNRLLREMGGSWVNAMASDMICLRKMRLEGGDPYSRRRPEARPRGAFRYQGIRGMIPKRIRTAAARATSTAQVSRENLGVVVASGCEGSGMAFLLESCGVGWPAQGRHRVAEATESAGHLDGQHQGIAALDAGLGTLGHQVVLGAMNVVQLHVGRPEAGGTEGV